MPTSASVMERPKLFRESLLYDRLDWLRLTSSEASNQPEREITNMMVVYAFIGAFVGFAVYSLARTWLEDRELSRLDARWFADLDAEMREEDRRHGH